MTGTDAGTIRPSPPFVWLEERTPKPVDSFLEDELRERIADLERQLAEVREISDRLREERDDYRERYYSAEETLRGVREILRP